MRELEFLPDWYPQIRRRRRFVVIQAWVSLAVLLAVGSWWARTSRVVQADEARLATLDTELGASRGELKALEELMTLQKKLGAQAQVLSKVGSHVESARLLATLDEVMPKSMALLELALLTEEFKPASLADARVAQAKDRGVERRLNVKLAGVAPTDVEVADFLTKLTSKPFFEDVRMTRSKPRLDNGRLMREFEVYFSMDLNDPAGTSPTCEPYKAKPVGARAPKWVLGGSIVALLAAFYVLGYRPLTSRRADTVMQIDTKQRELHANKTKTNIRAQVEQQVNDMRRKLERFDKQLPRTMEWGQFMNDITLLKEQSGVSNWFIEPTGAKAEEQFVTVPVALSFEGDFLGVFSFLRQMEQMQRLTRVRDLTLTSKRDGDGPGQVDVKLSMNIYYTEK